MSLLHPIRTPAQMRHPVECAQPDKQWLDGLTRENAWWYQGNDPNPANERERAAMERMFVLREKLLSFGGHLVCMPVYEEDYDAIMERGEFLYGKGARFRKGCPSQCHTNSALLWDANRGRCQIMTGYALSSDGCWHQHTWVVQPLATKWRVWETTEPRVGYFGFAMTDAECEGFYWDNT